MSEVIPLLPLLCWRSLALLFALIIESKVRGFKLACFAFPAAIF